jgi:aspartate kinase
LSKTLVIKLGGSILKDSASIKDVVASIKDLVAKGYRIVLVASAFKGVTDLLFQNSMEVCDDAPPWMLADFVSMGERSSVRLLAAALAAAGLNSVVVDPNSEEWPIVTDDNYLDANPILDITEELVSKKILPLLNSGMLPVVCGFLGKSLSGKVTLLGRGGSDTTAVLLGRFARADEVLLIKDSGGFMSADPDSTSSAYTVRSLSADEAYALSAGGAKVIQPKALRYKSKELSVRIAGLDSMLDGGTVIEGELGSLEASITNSRLAMITVLVGEGEATLNLSSNLLRKAHEANAQVISSVVEGRAILMYVENNESATLRLYDEIARIPGVKGSSIFRELSQIVIKGAGLETRPGIIQDVVKPLSENGINIYGIVTIGSSVRLFVKAGDAGGALELIRSSLGVGS